MSELLRRFPSGQVIHVRPPSWLRRPLNLLWEQLLLPLYPRGGAPIWSPSNSGPLCVASQVVTVHDLATIDYPEDFSWLYRGYYRLLFPRLLSKVLTVVTVSEYTRQRLIVAYNLDPARVRAIPLGVDHDRFKPQDPEAIASVRHRLNLPTKYVLYLGTFSVRKNVGQLIRAWSIIQARIDPDTYLVLAGGSGDPRVFRSSQLPELPPRTLLTGRIDEADLAPLIGGAEAFVYPSIYEGFGLPPLEAMACGTPCISSNATSLPEVVGNAAVLVDPHDDDALAKAIERVLVNPAVAAALREAGLIRAAAFSWHSTAAETWEVLMGAGKAAEGASRTRREFNR